jgi:phosphate transport system permease protein
MTWRQKKEKIFRSSCIAFSWVAVLILVWLLSTIFQDGWDSLRPSFFTNFPSRRASEAGIYASIIGSLWVIILTALFSVPVGVFTALYLEEYSPRNRWTDLVQINIATLSGMPSIVYGLLGLAIFVRGFGLDRSILAASLTMSLLVLPMIVIASQGAIRAVPNALREAAFALGARRYQVVFGQVLPAALPGIMTGIILAISRAMGESAPLILIGALNYMAFVPTGPMDAFTVLPVQIFNWAGRPQAEFHSLAAAGIIVLIVMLFALNFTAVLIRQRYQRYK